MTMVLQIKRRHVGNSGAPVSLKSGELAHNEIDGVLYIGKGDDGNGNATQIVGVGGAVKADAAAVTAALALKANATDTANALAAKADQSAFDTALATKAAASSVYTKTETDAKLADVLGGIAPEALNSIKELADMALSGDANVIALTATVATKAPSATTYTKTEVDAAILAAQPAGVDAGTF